MSNKNKEKFYRIRIFWEKYEKKIVLVVSLILVAISSFEVGILQGHKFEQKTLIIEKAPVAIVEATKAQENGVLGAQSTNIKAENLSLENKEIKNQECLFVGSKNSNKYHKPDCRFAKNIKPENLVCFKSEEEAKNRGYVGDKTCVNKQ